MTNTLRRPIMMLTPCAPCALTARFLREIARLARNHINGVSANVRECSACSRTKALGVVTLKYPRSIVRAAKGHARLRYAGGSRRWPQPVQVGDPEAGRLGN